MGSPGRNSARVVIDVERARKDAVTKADHNAAQAKRNAILSRDS
jgi:hypothetical protein